MAGRRSRGATERRGAGAGGRRGVLERRWIRAALPLSDPLGPRQEVACGRNMDVLALIESLGLPGRILASYLLGAVPFGFVMCRALKGVDLREVGSGNIGATNAMRVLGAPLGLIAFLLDTGKGFAPAFWLGAGDPTWQVACGAAAVLGHVFPIYLKFKGGKAVATGCGATLAIDPMIFVCVGLVWLVMLLVAGYVSLASIAMGLAFPIAAWALGQPPVVIAGTGGLTVLILVRHRSNMSRLLDGTETRTKLWQKLWRRGDVVQDGDGSTESLDDGTGAAGGQRTEEDSANEPGPEGRGA